MRYSASAKGFYANDIDYSSVPDDCVEIMNDNYQWLLEQQANGKEIVPDENGYPIAVDPV